MSLALVTLSKEEFDAFSARHPQGNFQQSSLMGEVRARLGVEVEYLGVRDDGELVAAALFELHRSRLSTFAEIHDGPLCDFANRELAAFFLGELGRRAKEGGAAQLEIYPEMPYEIFDTNGAPLPAKAAVAEEGSEVSEAKEKNDAADATPQSEVSAVRWPANVPLEAPAGPNVAALANIEAAGFVHGGFAREYTAVPQWRYVKDLRGIDTVADLVASYSKHAQRNLRIAETSFVSVERIGRDALPAFHAVCQLSCEKQGFENRELSYFETLYDCLGDKADFYIAYIDPKALLDSWKAKRDAFADRVAGLLGPNGEEPTTKKRKRQMVDAREQHEGAVKRVKNLEAFFGRNEERIPAAGSLFVRHPNEYIYLFSGADPVYAEYCATTALQHRAMSTCVEEGIPRYNMYGINGVFDDPNDPGRGLLFFKQGFNGYVEQLMGSFTLTLKPLTFAMKKLARKIVRG